MIINDLQNKKKREDIQITYHIIYIYTCMYVYTHTYIHILFSSYKHIIIRTSTRTNIMSSIACDGTIDDPIPEYDVLATVNEDDGQKKYLVYGSAYYIYMQMYIIGIGGLIMIK